jgi:uncharacterized protein
MTTIQHVNEKELLQAISLCLRPLKRVAIALSGGVDSAVLVAAAARILGAENVLAITVAAPMVPESDHHDAVKAATTAGVQHIILKVADDILKEPVFVNNPPNRCYLCKQLIFTRIINAARAAGFNQVCDGTNADDLTQYRPGLVALKELGVLSPLAAAGLTKAEIRILAAVLCPDFSAKPAMACLATRIPHGTAITAESMRRIDQAEQMLRAQGYVQIRVRDHQGLARLELTEDVLANGLSGDQIRQIRQALRESGFQYLTLDLDGYRTGSMEEIAAAKPEQKPEKMPC